jgi:uncharacterized membrane protein (UPF0127 family)
MGTNARRRRSLIRQAALLVAFGVALVLGWQQLTAYYERKELFTVSFASPDGRKTPEYYLRVSATQQARRQGLMYEPPEKLRNNRGMLFVFPTEQDHSFWMKNTPAPLDIIFVDSSRQVVGVAKNTTPFSEEGRSVGVPSKYVVELLAGTADRDGIAAGAMLESALPLPVAR